MGFMSYCRFEGTHASLRECLSDVVEHVNEEAAYPVSKREILEFRSMVENFHEFLCDLELLDADGNLDDEAICRVCDAMSKSYEDEDEEY